MRRIVGSPARIDTHPLLSKELVMLHGSTRRIAYGRWQSKVGLLSELASFWQDKNKAHWQATDLPWLGCLGPKVREVEMEVGMRRACVDAGAVVD